MGVGFWHATSVNITQKRDSSRSEGNFKFERFCPGEEEGKGGREGGGGTAGKLRSWNIRFYLRGLFFTLSWSFVFMEKHHKHPLLSYTGPLEWTKLSKCEP